MAGNQKFVYGFVSNFMLENPSGETMFMIGNVHDWNLLILCFHKMLLMDQFIN